MRGDGARKGPLKLSWGQIITRTTAEGGNGFQGHFGEGRSGLGDREREGTEKRQ